MVKKLAILCAPVLFVLVVGWAVIPVQAHCSGDETHNAKHKNDPCPVVGGGGGLFVTRNVINAFVLSYVVDGFEATTEVKGQSPIPRAGNLVSLAVNTMTNTLDNTAVFTVRVNGVDTTLQISVSAGVTSVQTIESNVDVVVTDDLVSLEIDTRTSTSGGIIEFIAVYEYQVD